MIHIYNEIGDLHSANDTSLVNAIPSDIQWNRMNSNPTVRVICTKGQYRYKSTIPFIPSTNHYDPFQFRCKIDAKDFMGSRRENIFFLPTGTKNELIV